MRLIDADAFKAYMRGALEQTRRCYPDGGEWAEAVTEEFCRDIDEQPTVQPETHWIPRSERLPKEKQSVLVTDGSVVWVCDIISTDEGYKWEDSHGYWLDLNEWIAWMELPELYKEGERSE